MSAHTRETQIVSTRKPMANIIGILTAVVLALATFVAFKNKEKTGIEITNRQAAEKKLDGTQARLKKSEATLANTKKDRATNEEGLAKAESDNATLNKSITAISTDLEAKNKEVEENKAKLEKIREELKEVGDIQGLAAKIRTTKGEIEELTQTISTSEAKLANLTGENTRVEGSIQNFRDISSRFAAKESDPALKTRINAIYSSWGFVTLGSGNNAGIVSSSNLDVVRDGETIAKLVVTAVEGGTASATVVPESLKPDTVLMVGDSVVAGKKDVK